MDRFVELKAAPQKEITNASGGIIADAIERILHMRDVVSVEMIDERNSAAGLPGFRIVVRGASAANSSANSTDSALRRRSSTLKLLLAAAASMGATGAAAAPETQSSVSLEFFTDTLEPALEWALSIRSSIERGKFLENWAKKQLSIATDDDVEKTADDADAGVVLRRVAVSRPVSAPATPVPTLVTSTEANGSNSLPTTPQSPAIVRNRQGTAPIMRQHSRVASNNGLTPRSARGSSLAAAGQHLHPVILDAVIKTLGASNGASTSTDSALSKLELKSQATLKAVPLLWLSVEYTKLERRYDSLQNQLQHLESKLQDNMTHVVSTTEEYLSAAVQDGDELQLPESQEQPSTSPRRTESFDDLSPSSQSRSPLNASQLRAQQRLRKRQHHLIELLLILTQHQLQVGEIKMRYLLDIARTISVDIFNGSKRPDGLHRIDNRKRFVERLYEEIAQREDFASAFNDLRSFEQEIGTELPALIDTYRQQCSDMIQGYKQRLVELREAQRTVIEKLNALRKEQKTAVLSAASQMTSSPPPSVIAIDAQMEVNELRLQLIDKKHSILMLKCDFLEDKLALFHHDQQDTDASTAALPLEFWKKSHHPLSTIRQRIHLLYLPLREMLVSYFDEELLEPETVFVLALMNAKLALRHQFTLERKLQLLKNKITNSLWNQKLAKIKTLVCEMGDVCAEFEQAQREQTKLVSQKLGDSPAATEGQQLLQSALFDTSQSDIEQLRLYYEIIKKRSDLAAVQLDLSERKLLLLAEYERYLLARRTRLQQYGVVNSSVSVSFVKERSVDEFVEDSDLLANDADIEAHADSLFADIASNREVLTLTPNYELVVRQLLFFGSADEIFNRFHNAIKRYHVVKQLREQIDQQNQELARLDGISMHESSSPSDDLSGSPSSILRRKSLRVKASKNHRHHYAPVSANRKALLRQMLTDVILNQELNSMALQELSYFYKIAMQETQIVQYNGMPTEDVYTLSRIQVFFKQVTALIIELRPDFAVELTEAEIYEVVELALFSQQQLFQGLYQKCLELVGDKHGDAKFADKSRRFQRRLLFNFLHHTQDTTEQDEATKEEVSEFKARYNTAIRILQALQVTKSPTQKLVVVTRAAKLAMDIMTQSVTNADGSAAVITTDDFLPLFICIVSLSNVDDLVSQVNFIRQFSSDELGSTELGFHSTTLEAAVYYVLGFGKKQQQDDDDEEEAAVVDEVE